MKSRIILATVLFIVPLFVSASLTVFPRSLSVGMRGEDVRALQKVLNTDILTRIAEVGGGSKGNETDYFGSGTKRALIKFQEKYRAELLTPAGLTSGTGFFGERTRIKMTNLLAGSGQGPSTVPVVTTTPPTPEPLPVISEQGLEGVVVKYPSQYYGKPGTPIEIFGWGFTPTDNTVYFGTNYAVVKAASIGGGSISIKVPNIPKGVYKIYVKNSLGESDKEAFFAVTDGVTPLPKIESITPDHATRGSTVTIKGSGFATTGNMLRTGINNVENLSSIDGSTLAFVIPLDTLKATTTLPADFKISVPVWVYVVNENGVSEGKSFLADF